MERLLVFLLGKPFRVRTSLGRGKFIAGSRLRARFANQESALFEDFGFEFCFDSPEGGVFFLLGDFSLSLAGLPDGFLLPV
jgi:hypothetical protein